MEIRDKDGKSIGIKGKNGPGPHPTGNAGLTPEEVDEAVNKLQEVMLDRYKYYTPTIDEFHVGFEYETYDKIRDGSGNKVWYINTLGNSPTEFKRISDKAFKFELQNSVRVKCLNKEDIESLGFKNEWYEHGSYSLTKDKVLITFTPKFSDDNVLIHIHPTKHRLFQGIIKNKSELKKLMQQLNIK